MAAQEIEVSKLTLVDSAGKPRAVLALAGGDTSVFLTLLNEAGQQCLTLQVSEVGTTVNLAHPGTQNAISLFIQHIPSKFQSGVLLRAADGTTIFEKDG
jgi:hypothetical protein